MSNLLIGAIVAMVMALSFYTIGVFAERKQGRLLWWHAVIFWLGFLCDSLGTSLMSRISGGHFSLTLHGVTGLIAILLMAFHAVWATIILLKKDQQAQVKFDKFSLWVWVIWLIPFVMGMFIGMM